MRFSDWPWGKRARVDEHGIVEELAPDHAVDFWVCCRVDERWTWKVLSHQHVGACVDCGAAVIYRISARSPHDQDVKKICTRCCQRRLEAES